jgi:hypothetical protein
MTNIEGVISTAHVNPSCVAHALRVDNLSAMKTEVSNGTVRTEITGTKLRSVIASVDDYLMNLAIAEEGCRYRKGTAEESKSSKGIRKRQQNMNLR